MKYPPFSISLKILNLVAEIQQILGEAKSYSFAKPSVQLRKENRIKTIHHSLAIEGNSLTISQMTALIAGKRVIGPSNEIQEVRNAVQLYDRLTNFSFKKESDFLKAHELLMDKLLEKPGQYRRKAVGIYKAGRVSRMAPPHQQVPKLMANLFQFLKSDSETLGLIKACVFHYELEFIHPFEDGNGRLGRLWQQRILMEFNSLFEHIPIESLIHQNQSEYYRALEKSDVQGESTLFIEFSLEMILKSLNEFGADKNFRKPTAQDRLAHARVSFLDKSFSRKDYMKLFGQISSATASRDLAFATKSGLMNMTGIKASAIYRFKTS